MSASIDSYHVSLKVLLKDAEGRVLVLSTLPGTEREGAFDLPGGRIDREEFTVPFADILRREVREELGEDVRFDLSTDPVALGRKRYRLAGASEEVHILFVFFEGAYLGGDITTNEEYQGFAWVSPTEENVERCLPGIADGLRQYLSRER